MSEKKQFEASAKKLRQAREKGDLAKSSLVTQGSVITAGSGFLIFFGQKIWERYVFLVEYGLSEGFREPVRMAWVFGVESLQVVSLYLLAVVVAGIAAELCQVGFLWRPSLALPDIERLNPVAGFSRVFSGLKKSLNFLLRAGVVVAVAAFTLSDSIEIGALSVSDPELSLFTFSQKITAVVKYGLFALGVFAALEMFKSKRDYSTKLSMSLDDMRREHKEEDGNPEIKQQRKHLHRAMINQDLITRVRKSKMVVVSKREG